VRGEFARSRSPVIPAQASRTAYRVALRRATHQLLDAPPVFVDPVAIRILGSATEAALRADPARFDDAPFGPAMRAFMAVRARFAEERLAHARAAGVRQLVILGAGLDTFAYRANLDDPPLAVWEVDYPATQAWKREMLAAAGLAAPARLTFVSIDFARESLADVLAAAGFDASGAVFSWLGVTQYLRAEDVLATLRYIASVTRAGGGVAFDYAVAPELLSLRERIAFFALAARVSDAGEPWLSSFVPDALAAQVRSCGFAVVQDMSPQALHERYLADHAERPKLGALARLLWAGAEAYGV
jgi:methyltransferase (TIGR00027 family)